MTGTAAGYVVGYDATRVNIPSLPKGAQAYAGYSTGSGEVPWTEADFAAHGTALGPCLRIDQDPAASDPTADVLDVENGAATIADSPGWAKRALADYKAGRRPGQRSPAIYCSASNVTAVVNALIGGGVTSGVGLFVANWSITEAKAIGDVLAAAGPFPIVGVQFTDPGPYDASVFSRAWLRTQSRPPGRPAPVPEPAPAPEPAPKPATEEPDMSKVIIITTTAPAGHAWEGTESFLFDFSSGRPPAHLTSERDRANLAAQYGLPAGPGADVSWEQFTEFGGT